MARSAASRAAMLREAVTKWMTLMRDLSRATGAVIHRPTRKSPTEPTAGAGRRREGGQGRGHGALSWAGRCTPLASLRVPKGPSEKWNK